MNTTYPLKSRVLIVQILIIAVKTAIIAVNTFISKRIPLIESKIRPNFKQAFPQF